MVFFTEAHYCMWDTFHYCGVLFNSSYLVFLGRPDAIKVQLREVRERAITVQWTPAFDGGRPITSYRMRIKDKGGTRRLPTLSKFGYLDTNYVSLINFNLHSNLGYSSE